MSDFTIRTSTTPPATVKVQLDPSQSVAEAVAAADAAAASEAAAAASETAAAGSASAASGSASAAAGSASAAATSAGEASGSADEAAASAASAAGVLAGALQANQNLGDVDDASIALTNLGLTATAAQINNLLPGRNLIINGSGRINQRGYVSGAATSGANQFTLDRWFVVTSGQNLAFTGDNSGRVMTAPAGGVSTVIEGANIVGGTYVLNWTGTATATVGGVARTKGETFTLTANTNVTVTFASGTFTDVQLERGSVVTPFEWRSIGQELALCQRFYQIVRASILFQSSGATEAGSTPIPFLTQMRATPTLANAGNIQSGNVSGAAAYEDISVNGARFTVVAAAAGGTLLVQDIFVVAELTS